MADEKPYVLIASPTNQQRLEKAEWNLNHEQCPRCKATDVIWVKYLEFAGHPTRAPHWAFYTDDGMPEPKIEFCPHCGLDLPAEPPQSA